MSRLRFRRPFAGLFVIEAARLANLNQTEQETWEQSWIQGVPPGREFFFLNMLRQHSQYDNRLGFSFRVLVRVRLGLG